MSAARSPSDGRPTPFATCRRPKRSVRSESWNRASAKLVANRLVRHVEGGQDAQVGPQPSATMGFDRTKGSGKEGLSTTSAQLATWLAARS